VSRRDWAATLTRLPVLPSLIGIRGCWNTPESESVWRLDTREFLGERCLPSPDRLERIASRETFLVKRNRCDSILLRPLTEELVDVRGDWLVERQGPDRGFSLRAVRWVKRFQHLFYRPGRA
jgi:hypothetical protein